MTRIILLADLMSMSFLLDYSVLRWQIFIILSVLECWLMDCVWDFLGGFHTRLGLRRGQCFDWWCPESVSVLCCRLFLANSILVTAVVLLSISQGGWFIVVESVTTRMEMRKKIFTCVNGKSMVLMLPTASVEISSRISFNQVMARQSTSIFSLITSVILTLSGSCRSLFHCQNDLYFLMTGL